MMQPVAKRDNLDQLEEVEVEEEEAESTVDPVNT